MKLISESLVFNFESLAYVVCEYWLLSATGVLHVVQFLHLVVSQPTQAKLMVRIRWISLVS